MAKKLNDYLNLKYHYNTKDSTTMANDLTKLKIDGNYRMITFDIKDFYVNIPIKETLSSMKSLLLEHNNKHITKQIISLLDIILQQIYLTSQTNIYHPEKGISMGSPISGIVAEIFPQHSENSHLNQILEAKNTVFCTRYIKGVLIIYDTKRTTSEIIHNYTNKIHPNLQFIPTHEHNNTISFPDLLIAQHSSKIETDIFRKPTTTDTTINFTNNHPVEHKIAAYCYLINRMISLPLTPERNNTEWQKILTIANSNKFPPSLVEKLK
jgi:hypothetical protein